MRKMLVVFISLVFVLSFLCSCKEEIESNQSVFVLENGYVVGLTDEYRKYSEITIPKEVDGTNVIGVGEGAFKKNAFLKKIIIEDGVLEIQRQAFSGCEVLEDITLPNDLVLLGEEAFSDCDKLKKIVLPSTLKTVGRCAFQNCMSLSEVTISEGVENLSAKSFYKCKSLTNVHIPSTLVTLGWEDGASVFTDCSNLAEFTVEEGNATYLAKDGNLYSADGKILVQYANGKMDTEFTVPDGTTTIGVYAFAYELELLNVNVAKTVVKVDYAAFTNCENLASVTFGGADSALVELSHRAFFGDTGLKDIEFTSRLKKIGKYVFNYCSALTTVKYYGSEFDWKQNIASNSNLAGQSVLEEKIRVYA